jgi:nucleoside-diphosphate-sugar epimerase
MKVLLAGGSGLVGSFITPYLRAVHELRVLDIRPPAHAGRRSDATGRLGKRRRRHLPPNPEPMAMPAKM